MKQFTPGKAIRRLVPIKSAVKGWLDQQFVVELTSGGVNIWRKGHRLTTSKRMSWRFIIGQGFIFGREDNPKPEDK